MKTSTDDEYEGKTSTDDEYEGKTSTDDEYEGKTSTDDEYEGKTSTDDEYEGKTSTDDEYEGKTSTDDEYEGKTSTDDEYEGKTSTDDEYEGKTSTDDEYEGKTSTEALRYHKNMKRSFPLKTQSDIHFTSVPYPKASLAPPISLDASLVSCFRPYIDRTAQPFDLGGECLFLDGHENSPLKNSTQVDLWANLIATSQFNHLGHYG